jgi:pimeloyl-ACP methyl ester carboxylesterase
MSDLGHSHGVQLAAERFGESVQGRVPVAVFPGLGVSRYIRPACRDLAQRLQTEVLLVDPPGFGANRSLARRSPTVAQAAEVVQAWLTGRGPIALIGQSTGCLLATRLARRYTGLDARILALVGPVFDPVRRGVARAGGALARDGLREPWWLGPLELPEWLRQASALPPYLKSCLADPIEDHLADVRCPVLIVRGDKDPLSRHTWAAELARGPQRADASSILITVPGGSHTFMAARPEALADALLVGGYDARLADRQ